MPSSLPPAGSVLFIIFNQAIAYTDDCRYISYDYIMVYCSIRQVMNSLYLTHTSHPALPPNPTTNKPCSSVHLIPSKKLLLVDTKYFWGLPQTLLQRFTVCYTSKMPHGCAEEIAKFKFAFKPFFVYRYTTM